MQPTDDRALLRQYVENQSDTAFAGLVARHINLVYSVALRHVGDPHHAEEITQAVFTILARKAGQLRHDKALSSWLFQTTRLTSGNFLRSESRRRHREQEAYMQSTLNEPDDQVWPSIAPLLDAAVAGLSEKDRHAIVLRFYEGRNLREVGAALGANEDAAEKRVTRAVERLRKFFTKRGVTLTAAAIAGAVSANSVQAAPAGLAKTISVVAAAKGAAASGSTLTLIKGALNLMAWTKAKTAIVAIAGALLAAGTATVAVKTYQTREHERTLTPNWRPASDQSMAGLTQPLKVWIENGKPSTSNGDVRTVLGANAVTNPIIFKTHVNQATLQRIEEQRELAAKTPDGKLSVSVLMVTRTNAPGLKANTTQQPPVADFQPGRCVAVNQPLAALIPFIEEYCGSHIADSTSDERFDFDLRWAGPHDAAHRNINGFKDSLREQLGLVLMPGKIEQTKVLIDQPK